jgi:hypothetical protein
MLWAAPLGSLPATRTEPSDTIKVAFFG